MPSEAKGLKMFSRLEVVLTGWGPVGCRVARCGAARALALALAILLAPTPLLRDAVAQDGVPSMYRRWVFALGGVVAFATPALFADDEEGRCATRQCMVPVAALVGGTLGFLIGFERDRVVARRFAGGPSLTFRRQTIDLEGLLPESLELFSGGALAVGREGLAVVGSDGMASRRGGEMRGITAALAVPDNNVILTTTPAGIFAFPLRAQAMQGRLLAPDGGLSLASIGGDQFILGGREMLRRYRVAGTGPESTLHEEARVVGPATFTSLSYSPFSGVVFGVAGTSISARSASGLEELGVLTLPAPARSISVSGGQALVAAGSEGVFLLDVSSPDALRLVARLTGLQYAFAAALSGSTAFIATGRTGLTVVDVSDPESPVLLGIARNLGMVSDVKVSLSGEVFVLDREGRRLVKVELVQPGSGSTTEVGGGCARAGHWPGDRRW